MNHFSKIKEALEYIDGHLDEQITFEFLAERYHFSSWYFHRIFSAIVGKTIAVYIRDRRLEHACILLHSTRKTVIDIGMECGYDSAQSFSRAFGNAYGISPGAYRKSGMVPVGIAVEEMIMKFTNRLKGGILLNPNIIKREQMIIAGVSGNGDETGKVWQEFENLRKSIDLPGKLSENGYEIRIHGEPDPVTGQAEDRVHVGIAVANAQVTAPYTTFTLPPCRYASFDVYVANGYESENNAIEEWLQNNPGGYTQRLLNGRYCVVEFYDERFHGGESGSIVEIWIPIEKK